MSDIKTTVADVSAKASSILGAFKGVASMFGPKIAAPVILASEVFDKLSTIDDDEASENVLGLTAISQALDKIQADVEAGNEIDIEVLKTLSENIRAIDASLDKFYKIIS